MELIIDTSSDELIAILKDKGKVYQAEKLRGKHQETLLPQIDLLLKNTSKTSKDIDVFGVVVGPGSFTGVRLAVSTVKAFCSVFDKKVIGINMLELLGEKLKDGQAAAIKCTSQKVYLVKKEVNSISPFAQMKKFCHLQKLTIFLASTWAKLGKKLCHKLL